MHQPKKPSDKKEVIYLSETIIVIEGQQYKKHDHETEELTKIVGELVKIVDRLTPAPPANDDIIKSLRVTKISINNLKIQGNIMSTQFGRAQKVTATVTGFNAALKAVGLGHLSGLTAVIDNPGVATIGTIDTANQTVDVLGVTDGTFNITYSGTNDSGVLVSFTDSGTISDEPPPPDNVVTSLGVTYSDPVNQ